MPSLIGIQLFLILIMYKYLFFLPSFLLSAYAMDGFYCAQKHAFIRVGMTIDEVLQGCGAPQMRQESGNIVRNQPMTRLSYNNMYKGPVYYWDLNKVYHIFSIPSSSNNSTVTVDIVDNKVRSVNLNGNGVQGTNACQYPGSTQFGGNPSYSNGASISVGDSYEQVIQACGNPDYTDETFMPVPVSKSDNPELWIYKMDQYNPSYHLIFINGVLKSVEKKD
jgi:hypothetical protein